MTFTIEEILQSIAGVIAAQYPQYSIYTSQVQQGISVPCFFISLMPSHIQAEGDNRWMRDIGIDIVFVQQRNIADRNVEIASVQEFLDYALDMFPYRSGEKTAMLHTYERSADIEDDELHYKFRVKARVSKQKKFTPMEVMESEVGIKE